MVAISKDLPETGFIKLSQIIGQKTAGYKRKSRQEIPPLIPVSRTTFLTHLRDLY